MDQIVKIRTFSYSTAPPWTRLGSKLESMCRKAIYEFELLKDVKKVAVALSGGKDSLSLLYLLKAISGKRAAGTGDHAVHVGGAFSCGAGVSEGFLGDLRRARDRIYLTCVSKQEREKLECYSCSRERRALIFEAAKKVGATTMAFGHHRDDSVQTFWWISCIKGSLQRCCLRSPCTTMEWPSFVLSFISLKKKSGNLRKCMALPVSFANALLDKIRCEKRTKGLIAALEREFPNARENLGSASLRYGSQKALNPSRKGSLFG